MGAVPIMRAPTPEHHYEVGDIVEVDCDYERHGNRLHGWIKGIVVQVDSKMIAVQFRANVYLTDGWMVPDHILWYPLDSENMRPSTAVSKKEDGENSEPASEKQS